MSESKHTKGPWYVASRRTQVNSDDGIIVCEVTGAESNASAIADAALIAAAPELLECCLLFARWVQAGQSFQYPPGSLQQVTAAILKATAT